MNLEIRNLDGCLHFLLPSFRLLIPNQDRSWAGCGLWGAVTRVGEDGEGGGRR